MSDLWEDEANAPLEPLNVKPLGTKWVSVEDMVPEWGRRVPVDVRYSWGWIVTMGTWDGVTWWYASEEWGWIKEADTRVSPKGRVERWFNLPAPERGEKGE